MSSIIVGDYFHEGSLKRALIDRIDNIEGLPEGYQVNKPKLYHTNKLFKWSRSVIERNAPDDDKITPSSAALGWFEGQEKCEIISNGILQGYSFKKRNDKCISNFSKIRIFQDFQSLCKKQPKEDLIGY